MKIARHLVGEMVSHAYDAAPNECCGLLAVERDGASVYAAAVYRAVNRAATTQRFEIDGLEAMRLLATIEDAGYELGGIYHSHPNTTAYPSSTDINFAGNWPGVEWIIVGLARIDGPDVRSYMIEGGKVREVALVQAPA